MKPRSSLTLSFISLLLLSVNGEPAIAQTNFVIGVQNFKEYLPYSQYQDKEYIGFNREVLDMFAKSRGYTFTYKALPITRLYSEFVQGSVDLKYPDSPNWSRDIKSGLTIKYSKPVVKYIDGTIRQTGDTRGGMSEFRQLGTVRGFTPFAYLKEIEDGRIELSRNSSILGLLEQVQRKRVDGAYFNIAVAKYYMLQLPGNVKLSFDSGLPHTRSTRHLSSHKYPQIIDEFDAFLISNKKQIEALKLTHRVEFGIN